MNCKQTVPQLCPHFGFCGGCLYQEIPYEIQLEEKQEKLVRMFDLPIEIVGSPKQYGYRNRMDFVCAFGKVGFRARGQYKTVVDLTDCKLLPERFLPLFLKLKQEISNKEIATYDYLSHKGYLRYMIFRLSANTNDLMVSFVTASNDEAVMPLINMARNDASSVNWLIHDGLADISFGKVHQWFGKPFIEEQIGSCKFKIGPNTFFQNNGFLCSKLFDEVKASVSGNVLDLYCGTGAISLYIASSVPFVRGVELSEESIESAKENALLNGLTNVSFEASEVREWLRTRRGCSDYETVVVDPPRIGLGGKIIRRLKRMEMKKIVYVSCNPSSLRDDIGFLSDLFDVQSIKAFDMFPQTPHVECVAVLVKKDMTV